MFVLFFAYTSCRVAPVAQGPRIVYMIDTVLASPFAVNLILSLYHTDRLIKVFREKFPPSVPWQTVGVQYVIEASGMFTSLEKASVGYLITYPLLIKINI